MPGPRGASGSTGIAGRTGMDIRVSRGAGRPVNRLAGGPGVRGLAGRAGSQKGCSSESPDFRASRFRS